MQRWKYVGPKYAAGVILRDNSIIFPEALTDDVQIDDILAAYPELAPYWRPPSEVDAGTGGVSDKNYVHNQANPSTEWIVTHNLGKYPSVSIVDSGKNVVIGNIQHISINQFVLSFGFAFSGAAYCN